MGHVSAYSSKQHYNERSCIGQNCNNKNERDPKLLKEKGDNV